MSLAMVLANPYGIVMTADRRLTLKPKKTYDNMYVLYPTLLVIENDGAKWITSQEHLT